MDARSLVTVLLTLFLGTAISLKGAQASTEGCSDITPELIKVTLSHTEAELICDDGTEWSIGSNLCDPSSFTEYSSCSGKNTCDIPASEYLVEGPTYVICRARLQPVAYFEIVITPTTIHQVPPVVIAGKRVQVHTIITSKPHPSPTNTLGVAIYLITQNVSIVPLGNASTELVSDPTNVTRFFAIHTFDVPSDIDEESEAVFIRFHFTEPGTWMNLDLLVQSAPVVTVPRVVPPSTLPTDTTEPTTEGGDGTVATPHCYEPHIVAAAAIVPAVVLSLLMVFLTYCVCSLKGKCSKHIKNGAPTAITSSRNKLSLPTVVSPATTCSAVSTPGLGYTPTSETTVLFPGPGPDRSGGSMVAGGTGPASSNGIMNSGFQRQCSGDSNSTNSPTDADRLLSVADSNVSTNNLTTSVGLSVSTGTTCSGGIMPELRPVTFESDQNQSPPSVSSTLDRDSLRAKSGDSATAVVQEYLEPTSFSAKGVQGSAQTRQGAGNDPRYHTYSTISEAVNQVAAVSTVHHHHSLMAGAGRQSLTTGSGRQLPASGRRSGSAEPSLQLSLQTRQNYEMHNSGSRVPMPSLTTATHPISTSAETLISPPPPSADPNYSTGGRNMHLLPQYNCDQPNATNV